MKRKLAAWVMVAGMMGGQAVAADLTASKVGYVDMPYLFIQSEIGKDYAARLKAEYAKKEKEMQPKQEVLKAEIERYQAQKSMLSSDRMKKREEDIQQQMKDFEKGSKEAQMELMKTDEKFTKEVMGLIYDVVKDVAMEEKYEYVFEKKSLLFGGDDLTPKVMKALNERGKKKKK